MLSLRSHGRRDRPPRRRVHLSRKGRNVAEMVEVEHCQGPALAHPDVIHVVVTEEIHH